MIKLNQFFKKPIFIVLALLAIFLFVFSIVLQVIANRQDIKPQSLSQPSLKQSHIQPLKLQFSFSGQMPQLDSKVTVFNSEMDPTYFQQQLVDYIASNFGFNQNVAIDSRGEKSTAIFNKQNEDLVISFPPLTIEYGNYAQTQNTKLISKPEDFIGLAQKYIKDKALNLTGIDLDKGYVQMVKKDEQGITTPITDPKQADFIFVKFNYLLDNKPLIDKERRDYPVQILFNLDGSIRKATIILPPSDITTLGNTNITTPEQALQAINAGQGVFSTLNNPQVAYTEISQKDMNTATFNSVELVYVYDYDTGSIQPFYRFQGYGYTKNGDKIEVGVIITALPQNLYK